MQYFVYIVFSNLTKKSYSGITLDINRRLIEHNRQLANTRWTREIQDFEVVFLTEVDSRIVARQVEKWLKSGIGREFKNQIIADYLGL